MPDNADTDAPCLHRKIILRQDATGAYRGGAMEFGQPFHYCTECGAVVKVTLAEDSE